MACRQLRDGVFQLQRRRNRARRRGRLVHVERILERDAKVRRFGAVAAGSPAETAGMSAPKSVSTKFGRGANPSTAAGVKDFSWNASRSVSASRTRRTCRRRPSAGQRHREHDAEPAATRSPSDDSAARDDHGERDERVSAPLRSRTSSHSGSGGGSIELAAPSSEIWPVGSGGVGAAVSEPSLSRASTCCGRGVPAGTTFRMIAPRGRAILRNAGIDGRARQAAARELLRNRRRAAEHPGLHGVRERQQLIGRLRQHVFSDSSRTCSSRPS